MDLLNNPAAIRYNKHVDATRNICKDPALPPLYDFSLELRVVSRRLPYLYSMYPINAPTPNPQATASGKEDGGRPRPAPMMNTTPSMPSRSTVTNGNRNIAYFSPKNLRPFGPEASPTLFAANTSFFVS